LIHIVSVGMGCWALLCALSGPWIMGLPKPCWYWWEDRHLVSRMHPFCYHV